MAHYITPHGNNREDVYFSDQDRVRSVEILREQVSRYGVRVLAGA